MKLYVVTRQDLSPGQQAVQAMHGLRAFVARHPDIDRHWYEVSNTLAFLAVRDETELKDLSEKAALKGLPIAEFREPDLNNALTALALGPQAKKLCARLELALRPKAHRAGNF